MPARRRPVADDVLPDHRIVAANIIRLRVSQGISQRDLAARAKISRTTLLDIELAHASPRLDKLLRIAQALGVPAADLFLSHADRAEVDYKLKTLVDKICATMFPETIAKKGE